MSAVLVYFVLFSLVALTPFVPSNVADLVSQFGRIPLVLIGLLATMALSKDDRIPRRLRRVWRILTLALGCFLAGELAVKIQYHAFGIGGYDGWAGVLFLVGYGFFVAALFNLPHLFRAAQDASGFVIDALIVAIGAAMALWVIALRPLIVDSTDRLDALGAFYILAYPAGDVLVLFALTVVLMRLPQGSPRAIHRWMALAGLSLLCGDALAALMAGGALPKTRLATVFWALTPVLFLRAAQLQYRFPSAGLILTDSHSANGFATLPFVGGLLGVGVLTSRAGPADIVWFSAVLMVLILIRLAVSKRQAASHAFESAQSEASTRLQAILAQSADAVAPIDGRGAIVFSNPALEGITGENLEQADRFVDLVCEGDRKRFESVLQRSQEVSPQQMRIALDGEYGRRTVAIVISNHDDDDSVNGTILNIRDISHQADLEEQLAQKVLKDPLTELPNRILLLDRVAQALSRAENHTDIMVAIIVADLDKFKLLNDSYGHAFGDQLLIAASQRLVEVAPETATIARVADDEFAIVLEDELTVSYVTSVAESILAAFRADFEIEKQRIAVTISLGIAGPSRSGDAEEMLRRADVALNEAKGDGRNRICAFEPKIDRALESNAAILAGLRRALDEKRIEVAFQPIYDIVGNHLWGLETLARWVDPQRGRIAPGVFISAAEDGGLMGELGTQIIERALEHARAVKRKRPFSLAINISIQQFADAGFSDMVLSALKRARWPAERLILEITESIFAEERRVIKNNLTHLRSEGVRIAIDDFGTGYSSLAQLHDFPIDILKIDRGFVEQVDTETGRETIKAILAIGRALELTIIAEGVESDEQLRTLRELDCRLIQGFLFGQPLFSTDLHRMATMAR